MGIFQQEGNFILIWKNNIKEIDLLGRSCDKKLKLGAKKDYKLISCWTEV